LRRFLNDLNLFLHFCNYFPFEQDLALNFNHFEFPLPKGRFVQCFIEIGQLYLKKNFLNDFQFIFTHFLLSPLGKGGCPSYQQFEFPSPKYDLSQLWLQLP
jgi:hypothetical protein